MAGQAVYGNPNPTKTYWWLQSKEELDKWNLQGKVQGNKHFKELISELAQVANRLDASKEIKVEASLFTRKTSTSHTNKRNIS